MPRPARPGPPELPVRAPRRGGTAGARLLRERGLSADIKPAGPALVLIVRNPAVPFGKLAQKVALVTDDEHGEAFAWLFEGTQSGTWDTEVIGAASEVKATSDRLVRVLALAGQDGDGE